MNREQIIEALERGEVGREIDAAVFRAFGYTVKALEGPGHIMAGRFLAYPPEGPQRCEPARLAVSTSLDAAVALVERVRPGVKFAFSPHDDHEDGWYSASLLVRHTDKLRVLGDGYAPSPAAALLAALLKSEG